MKIRIRDIESKHVSPLFRAERVVASTRSEIAELESITLSRSTRHSLKTDSRREPSLSICQIRDVVQSTVVVSKYHIPYTKKHFLSNILEFLDVVGEFLLFPNDVQVALLCFTR